MTSPHEIDQLTGDGVLMIAIILYPSVITLLSKKNTFEKVGNLSKSSFSPEQKMNWQDLLKLPFFNEDQDHVAELLDVEPESV